jgi:exosome complex component RRP4
MSDEERNSREPSQPLPSLPPPEVQRVENARREEEARERARKEHELWKGRGRREPEERRPRPEEPVNREIVIPGEVIASGRVRAGPGTFKEGDDILSACLGIKMQRDGYVSVIPLTGKYIPKQGDVVVGKVIEMTPSAWVIDLNSPYVSPLSGAETPWEVEFNETSKYMVIGDTVLIEIRGVDSIKKVSVTMNGPGLRKLEGGQTMDIDASKVPRLIGRGGSMISLLKRLTRCRILVGQNGRVWLDGTVDDIHVAMAAIRKIESEAHRLGLTDAVAAFIEDMRKELDARRAERELSRDAREEYAIMKNKIDKTEEE